MMHKSPILKILCIAAWLITGLVSINIGLGAVGFHLTQQPFFVENFAPLLKPMAYVIGLAGAWSLISLGMMLFGACKCGCGCGSCSCDCDKKRPYSM